MVLERYSILGLHPPELVNANAACGFLSGFCYRQPNVDVPSKKLLFRNRDKDGPLDCNHGNLESC